MKYINFLFFLLLLSIEVSGQNVSENLAGKVSFKSTQNVYVKFTSTIGISPGDTLFKISDGKQIPVLKVINTSSTSCVCSAISSPAISTGDLIFARKKNENVKTREKPVEKAVNDVSARNKITRPESKPFSASGPKQRINGSISAFGYSDFSNTSSPNSTRFRYNLNLDVRNIADSKFSFESYASFNHKLGDWSAVKNNVFDALKIYSLAVKYDLNKTTQISLGRKINQRISSIGAMDGLQVETTLNKFVLGAVVGLRPDFNNYGFDPKLLQYGAYVAFNTNANRSYSESSVAFMQQMNNGYIDRRFLYFQHSNSLLKNLYLFGTFEVDLYKLKSDSLNNSTPQNTFDLTGLYLSLRYRMTKKLTLTCSYDSRKNVVYYETYKTFIDRILESEMRQSLRLQADYRLTDNITFGLQSGYRFLKSDPHPTKNLYGYLSYYRIPGLNVSATLSGTYLISNYLDSKIAGVTLSRDFLKGKFYTEVGYRYIDYTYTEGLNKTVQNIGSMGISWLFAKKISFSFNYDGTFEKKDMYSRFYLQIRKRF